MWWRRILTNRRLEPLIKVLQVVNASVQHFSGFFGITKESASITKELCDWTQRIRQNDVQNIVGGVQAVLSNAGQFRK